MLSVVILSFVAPDNEPKRLNTSDMFLTAFLKGLLLLQHLRPGKVIKTSVE
jgi:hypothetical protein